VTPALPDLTLILGGARSGKSAFAERMAHESGLDLLYLATAQAHDDEMTERIARHRRRRDPAWATVEEPLALADTLRREMRPGRLVLVDCLTLWLSNLLHAGKDVAAERDRMVEGLRGRAGPVLLVSNEVGQGIVPANALARRFVDEAGLLHQAVAAVAHRVVLLVAGLALELKPRGG
jgi:adenosylcobinamide kinase/adenosylcobinamide-phosphate guanylyltransferase